jgi:hypothetical protein
LGFCDHESGLDAVAVEDIHREIRTHAYGGQARTSEQSIGAARYMPRMGKGQGGGHPACAQSMKKRLNPASALRQE